MAGTEASATLSLVIVSSFLEIEAVYYVLPEQLRRYLIGNPWPKDHKEDPSTDGRITSNRTFAKWR